MNSCFLCKTFKEKRTDFFKLKIEPGQHKIDAEPVRNIMLVLKKQSNPPPTTPTPPKIKTEPPTISFSGK